MSWRPKVLAAKEPTGDVCLPYHWLPQPSQFALFLPMRHPCSASRRHALLLGLGDGGRQQAKRSHCGVHVICYSSLAPTADLLASLKMAGCLRTEDAQKEPGKAGRPKERWRVNPCLTAKQELQQ